VFWGEKSSGGDANVAAAVRMPQRRLGRGVILIGPTLATEVGKRYLLGVVCSLVPDEKQPRAVGFLVDLKAFSKILRFG